MRGRRVPREVCAVLVRALDRDDAQAALQSQLRPGPKVRQTLLKLPKIYMSFFSAQFPSGLSPKTRVSKATLGGMLIANTPPFFTTRSEPVARVTLYVTDKNK